MLQWYRSWPHDVEFAENNLWDCPRVIDSLPRMLMAKQDYKTIRDYNSLQTVDGWPENDFCMLEWDIALDPWARLAFAAEALCEPHEILVAPYRFHETWCMWVGNDGSGPSSDGRPIQRGETHCDSFGLGCIYIPRSVLTEFLTVMDKFGFSDGTFGKWYHEKYGKVRVTWNVYPQHLHEYPRP